MTRRLRCLLPPAACALTLVSTAAAADPPEPSSQPPSRNWAIGVERLFGLRHTRSERRGISGDYQTSLSLGSQVLAGESYATPRVGADYLLDLGLSFGAALAYGTFRYDRSYDDYEDSSWLLAPRVGFLWLPLPSVGIWPRLGLTLLQTESSLVGNLSALTLEAPVEFFLPGHILTLTAAPYAELGYSAGSDGFFDLLPTDHSAIELGLALGAAVFF
jgi:hypothetical protein